MDFSFLFLFILDLGLEVFPASEPAHIIASIGASSPPTFGDPTTEEYVNPTAVFNPPPSSSSDASLRSMLDTVMTIQAAHG